MTDHQTHLDQLTLVIRPARPDDGPALVRLAQLEGRGGFDGERVLVAELDGSLRAAVSLDRRRAIADPFHPTAALLEVLELRAAHLRGGRPARRSGGVRSWLAGLRHPKSDRANARPAMARTTPGNAALMISRIPR